MCLLNPILTIALFFDASTLQVQALASELTHTDTYLNAQARPTGFARDGHVTLTIVTYPRVRLQEMGTKSR